jgi:hypothetical protein
MIGDLYEIIYQLSYNIRFIDYEVWVFAKNTKVILYGKPTDLYHNIGSYFREINVIDYIIDEDMQYINLHIDL